MHFSVTQNTKTGHHTVLHHADFADHCGAAPRKQPKEMLRHMRSAQRSFPLGGALKRISTSSMSSTSSSSTTAAAAVGDAPSAAVCVIGNEVLTGKTHDTNSMFIAKMMFRRGVDLKRIVVIPDEMDVISSTVKELSDLVGPNGYVFTTGGIGPTHDDITYEGVAKAFGLGLELHQPTADGLRDYLVKQNRGHDLNEDRLRMALLPAGCQVLKTASWVPIALVHNVYVLPGIPSMVREMLTYNEEHFVGVPIHRAIVHTMKYEGDIAKPMTAIQKKYPSVAIGSYVNLTQHHAGVKDESYNTRLTIEGRDADEVETVADELAEISSGTRFQAEAL